ncbi:MAG: polysaccharide deacetylase family protein [Oscillospiraceae bacterium]|nr:polysaccharide deacetylase family protein [Oscillospiraceae bacterium]
MWNGKMKAVTFSFDDGVTQDIRLIRIFNKFSLKCTFNINSELLGLNGEIVREGERVSHNKIRPEEVRKVYSSHEVAAHTLTHPNLAELTDESEILRQVTEDKKNLSALSGQNVVGMAYPGGGVNYTPEVAELLKRNNTVSYARTTVATYNFSLPKNLFTLHPTVHMIETEKLFALADEFLAADPQEPMLFYIWGHSYEFDIHNTWDTAERFCEKIAGHSDIFYGTNAEILLK